MMLTADRVEHDRVLICAWLELALTCTRGAALEFAEQSCHAGMIVTDLETR